MPKTLFYPIGNTKSSLHCAGLLSRAGIECIDHPSPEVTHLLLDIPTASTQSLERTLSMLPPDICVIGGNLNLSDWKVWDFLKDERYLARNAAITAHCAAFLAMNYIPTTLPDTPTLIIGWGRIGKCLAALLKSMGCPVSVATGSHVNEAMLQALGYGTKSTASLDLKGITLLINTAPVPVLSEAQLAPYPGLIKLDLASRPGLAGEDVISARGLPGKYAPESSGKLQFETILRYLKEDHP